MYCACINQSKGERHVKKIAQLHISMNPTRFVRYPAMIGTRVGYDVSYVGFERTFSLWQSSVHHCCLNAKDNGIGWCGNVKQLNYKNCSNHRER
jgi:hypothetical protein